MTYYYKENYEELERRGMNIEHNMHLKAKKECIEKYIQHVNLDEALNDSKYNWEKIVYGASTSVNIHDTEFTVVLYYTNKIEGITLFYLDAPIGMLDTKHFVETGNLKLLFVEDSLTDDFTNYIGKELIPA